MAELQGKRVAIIDLVKERGDYVPIYGGADGAISSLWFVMPDGTQGRIAAKGYEKNKTDGELEPGWTITEDEAGVITVDPSINYEGHWHGRLIAGLWSW